MKENPSFRASRMVEEIVGCKWSLHILARIRNGTCRPGALSRSIEGLSTKVLNERLAKMVRFGILEKHSYPEIPPRVEYTLTGFGSRIAGILDAIEDLQKEMDSESEVERESEV
jgi:DNA-binding HxlR family transcriptional regulator